VFLRDAIEDETADTGMQGAAPLVVVGGVAWLAGDAMSARAARRDRGLGFKRTRLPEKSRPSVRTELSRKTTARSTTIVPRGR